jgi:hypothetical protein
MPKESMENKWANGPYYHLGLCVPCTVKIRYSGRRNVYNTESFRIENSGTRLESLTGESRSDHFLPRGLMVALNSRATSAGDREGLPCLAPRGPPCGTHHRHHDEDIIMMRTSS